MQTSIDDAVINNDKLSILTAFCYSRKCVICFVCLSVCCCTVFIDVSVHESSTVHCRLCLFSRCSQSQSIRCRG